jgi:predicted tellurium resistance membrane protein TerC
MELFLHSETWIALLTLTFLEIILGVDNIIFISIVSNKLPDKLQARARNIGLSLALIMRIGLLLVLSQILAFTEPLFTLLDFSFSARDIILLAGGLFLIFKSTSEIHHKIEGHTPNADTSIKSKFSAVILQIVLLDMIFSVDSILTAIGLVEHVQIMIIAVIIAMIIMMIFAGSISTFINKHPTLQILALAFLILIGFMLILEGVHYHIPKGYVYFAVFFSLIVEVVNINIRKKRNPVALNMRIVLKTPVNQRAIDVWKGFNKDLFLKLSPPFPAVKLLRFDGSTKGDQVGLELNFGLFKQKWISDITANGENDREIYFVDQGVKLPFFLKKWKHTHIITKLGEHSEIVDDVNFSTGTLLTDLIMLPGLYLQFLYRKPIYKKFFS